jgi:indole-3-glycerol phosphate synthase
MSNILDEIVVHKRQEIAASRRERTESDLEEALAAAAPVRDFAAALREKHPLGLIAEVKRASPSAGLIRDDFDPVVIARIYEAHGAGCISVLTDEHFFQGSLQYLRDIRSAVSVPLLRKDFILDRYQILEARAAGADCVLLIAECLDQPTLVDLHECIVELGMQALIEIYDPENLERVLSVRPALLGINNRNLRTFVTDLDHSIRLRPRIPDDLLLISESGIHSRNDVARLQDAGIHAILVGETLMRSPDIGAKVDELIESAG